MQKLSASSQLVHRLLFLSLYLSSSTGKNARADDAKSLRMPLARRPRQATASATHTTLLSLTITFFSSRSTSPKSPGAIYALAARQHRPSQGAESPFR